MEQNFAGLRGHGPRNGKNDVADLVLQASTLAALCSAALDCVAGDVAYKQRDLELADGGTVDSTSFSTDVIYAASEVTFEIWRYLTEAQNQL